MAGLLHAGLLPVEGGVGQAGEEEPGGGGEGGAVGGAGEGGGGQGGALQVQPELQGLAGGGQAG